MFKGIKKLISNFGAKLSQLTLYAVSKILQSVFVIAQPFLFSVALAKITEGNYSLSLMFVMSAFLVGVLAYFAAIYAFSLEGKIRLGVSQSAGEQIIKTVLKQKSPNAEAVNMLITADVPQISDFYCKVVSAFCYIIKVVLSLTIIALNNLVAAGIVLGFLVIHYIIDFFIFRSQQNLKSLCYNSSLQVNEKINELISKNQIIVGLGVEDAYLKQNGKLFDDNLCVKEKLTSNKNVLQTTNYLLWQIASLVVIGYIFFRYNSMLITFTSLAILFDYTKSLSNTLTDTFGFKPLIMSFNKSLGKVVDFVGFNNEENVLPSPNFELKELAVLVNRGEANEYNRVVNAGTCQIVPPNVINAIIKAVYGDPIPKTKVAVNGTDLLLLSTAEKNLIFEVVDADTNKFFSGTIKGNYELINKTQEDLPALIKKFKLTKFVNSLAVKTESSLQVAANKMTTCEALKFNLLFAYISGARVIIINEDNLTQKETKELTKLLTRLTKGKIILLLGK